MIKTPLEQFKLKPIIKIYNNLIDITITNSTIVAIMAVGILILIFNTKNKVLGNRWSRIGEKTIEGIDNQIREILGETAKRGKKYKPIIITISIYILGNNMIGMVPYSYTTTSQIIVTILMSMSIWVGVTIIGIKEKGRNYIKTFIPAGIPIYVLPLIMLIEIVSNISRIISLSVRLTANMVAGHTIIKIIASYGYNLAKKSILISIVPLVLISVLFMLELGVAGIQAYVFGVLMTTYIKESLEFNH